MNFSIDQTDIKIIDLLTNNSRLSWKEIGDFVHMTGQAVATRVRRLEEIGILEGYTIKVNEEKMGKSILAIVTVFMKTTNHNAFQQFLKTRTEITEALRISGEGCYNLRVNVSTHDQLVELLDLILPFGNYRVNLSIKKIK